MDTSNLDASKLNETDRKEVAQIVNNEAQKAQIQSMVHELTNVCWKKCITGKVSGGALDKSEESCAQNCVERYMDTNVGVFKHLQTMRESQ